MGIKVIVDLRSRFGEVRDQGARPTCMAFAASDAHACARASIEALSAEYAFYYANQRKADRDRTKGVPFDLISQAIAIDGQPLEAEWPYLKTLTAADEWQPPKVLGAVFYRTSRRIGKEIADIFAHLDAGQPLILIVNISVSFFLGTKNIVIHAPTGEPRINTHAIIAVGYGQSEGSRCMLIRNSWGGTWCDGGYGWIDEEYLKPRLLVVGVMD